MPQEDFTSHPHLLPHFPTTAMADDPSKKRKRSPEKFTGPVAGGGEDRISDLPNDVLISILSLVPTHIAVRMGVLSKTWNRLWIDVPNLDLDRAGFKKKRRFSDFVDRVISLRVGSEVAVRGFRLSWPNSDAKPQWLQHAIHGCDLRSLVVDLYSLGQSSISPYVEIFSHRSLEVLELSLLHSMYRQPFQLQDLAAMELPRLGTLRLSKIHFSDGSLQKIISRCPLLKDLHLSWCTSDSFDIESPGLERLLFRKNYSPRGGPAAVQQQPQGVFRIAAGNLRWLLLHVNTCFKPRAVDIHAPRLAHLDLYTEEWFGSFVTGFPSLSEAVVDVFFPLVRYHGVVPIVQKLHNVSSLTLSKKAIMCLYKEQNIGYLPMFFNLKHLKIRLNKASDKYLNKAVREVLRDLLQKSPSLESLKIDNEETLRRNPKHKALECLHQLKTFQFEGFGGTMEEIDLLKLLIKFSGAKGHISMSFNESKK